MEPFGEALVGLAILVGIAGIVVPVLPGSVLVFAALLVRAVVIGDGAAWAVFAVAGVAIVAALVVRYVLSARRLSAADVPSSTFWWASAAGVVGFFVIPVVGLFVAFPLTVFLFEWRRLDDVGAAWSSTVVALRAVGLQILVELAGALLAAGAWVVGLVVA